MQDTNGVDLDLDALEPKIVQINYKGQLIRVNPLTLTQYSKLVTLSSDIVDAQKAEDPKVMTELIGRVKELINEAIPELADKELNPQQVLAIYKLIVQLSSPEDKAIKQLEQNGITLKSEGDGDPKASTSSGQ